MGSPVTITPDAPPSAGAVTITPDDASPRGFLSTLADQPSQFSHLNPLRYVDELGQGMAKGVEAIAHPIDTAKQIGAGLQRGTIFDPQADEHAAEDRAAEAKPFKEQLGDVADTLAQGYGQMATGAAAGKVLDAATDIPKVKALATAPIRAGVRTAEAALNSKAKPIAKLMTPADEAAASPVKLPGRDVGLPKRGAIAQGMDPASSPSRTLPGQLPPEQIVPPAAKPADPIPPRSGLALPAAPVGAELAELPATGAKPASQTGEALGQIKRGAIAKSVQPPKQLPEAFQPLPPKAPPVPGTVDAPFQGTPQRGSIASAMQPQSTPPIARGSLSQLLQQQLEESMGGKPLNPKMPLRSQIDAAQPEADMPQGHTAVQSSAMRSKLYDPGAQEFHARLTSGDTTYVYGDVSPDEAQAFELAKSKGQAFQTIKQNHPLVAKIVNGKRMNVNPGRGSIAQAMPTK